MERIASQRSGDLARFGLDRMLFTARDDRRVKLAAAPGDSAGDMQTARTLARVGGAGLLALPALMVASVVLQAPLAGPAAISLGYLGAARAIASRNGQGAAIWSAAVLGGLLVWVLAVLGFSMRPLSAAGWAALLLACAFAAGPALVEAMRARTTGRHRNSGVESGRGRVLDDVRPGASRMEGAVLARGATEKGGAHSPAVVRAESLEGGRNSPEASCDVGEAIAFALRHASPKAASRDVAIVAQCAPDLLAACDQQVCRRILYAMAEAAVAQSGPGETVRILGKAVKGTVLLRVTCPAPGEADGTAQPHSFSSARLRQTVEDAGGTVVLESSRGTERASVRLPRSERSRAQ